MTPISFKNKSIIAIADTHGRHRELTIPKCDILIHCGDVCNDGDEQAISDFFEWFAQVPAQYKLFISGNHDYPFVFDPLHAINLIPANIIFAENGMKTIAGISFLGITSQCNLFKIPELQKSKVDFLLTHVPPKSILDNGAGCKNLYQFVKKQEPQFHIFGHIHEKGKQTITKGKTQFFNACCFIH